MTNTPEVAPFLPTLEVQLARQGGDGVAEVNSVQRCPQLTVRVLVERVKVHPQCAGEQNRVLTHS